MRIVLLILLPDPLDVGSSLFCYNCSSVALALLPASLGWSTCSGGCGHLQQEERGFSCDALGCLTLSLFAGRDVLWEQCGCATMRKLPEAPVATLKEVCLDDCCHAIKPPLSPGGFLACFEEVRSCSDEEPLFHLHLKNNTIFHSLFCFHFNNSGVLQDEGP